MALGAERHDVLRLIVTRWLALALAGVAAGTVGAFALSRLMASLLYGVRPDDPATFAAVSVFNYLKVWRRGRDSNPGYSF